MSLFDLAFPEPCHNLEKTSFGVKCELWGWLPVGAGVGAPPIPRHPHSHLFPSPPSPHSHFESVTHLMDTQGQTMDLLSADLDAVEIHSPHDALDDDLFKQILSDISPLLEGIVKDDQTVLDYCSGGTGCHATNYAIAARVREFIAQHPIPNFPILPPLTSDFNLEFEVAVGLGHLAKVAKTHPCWRKLAIIIDQIEVGLAGAGFDEFV